MIAWLGILLSAGCAPAQTETPATNFPAAPGGAWTIRMTLSGGIMGAVKKMEIRSDGSYIVIDERASRTRSGRLSLAETAALAERASSIEPQSNQKQFTCADCYIYNLEVSGEGGRFTAQVDDLSLPGSGLEALITSLREIMERELQ
jgi:hypothetical protein